MAQPKLRISPSGPLADDSDIPGVGSGFILKQNVKLTPVVVGTLVEAPRELQADMTNSTPTMRPKIENVITTNVYQIETDFDFDTVSPSSVVVALQVSRDNGANWVALNDCSYEFLGEDLDSTLVHCHLNTEFLLISSIANVVNGDDLIARVMVSLPTGEEGRVISSTNATCTIREMLA